MRAADRTLPTVTLDPDACATWPIRPVLAIESKGAEPYQWDAGWQWDTDGLVWDAATVAPVWVDATCDFTGCEVAYGPPDEHGQFPAGRCAFTLDNRSGRWAAWNVDGSPSAYGPGNRVAVYMTDRGSGQWWLFYGRVAIWDERAGDVIEVEAFDPFADLAQPIGTYTPGAAGDKPGARLGAILTTANTAPRTRFATGIVTLTAQLSEQAPLEEMQTVIGSDGGLLFGDADGTIVSTERTWRGSGRADQTVFPTIATNVCTSPIVVWDPVVSSTDQWVAGTVVLENVAGLRATASRFTTPRFVIAETDQQWATQGEGDQLALDMVAGLSPIRFALAAADLYPFDPRTPALLGVFDWRILDRVRVLHDSRTPTGTARIDVDVMLIELRHAFTANAAEWVTSIGTSRALAYLAPQLWDQTIYTWDDPSPLNVWGY